HFILDPDRAGQRFLVTLRKKPGAARDKKQETDYAKNDRDDPAARQFERANHGEPQEEQRGERSADAMPGNVNHPMRGKEERRDESCDAKTLVGSFPQRKHAPDEQDDP